MILELPHKGNNNLSNLKISVEELGSFEYFE